MTLDDRRKAATALTFLNELIDLIPVDHNPLAHALLCEVAHIAEDALGRDVVEGLQNLKQLEGYNASRH